MVRGWWPAIVLSHLPPKPNVTVQNERFARFFHLPWSMCRVGGLLLSYHLLWSGVGGQLLFYHICHQNQMSQSKTSVSRDFIICPGPCAGLVVCYCLIICCGQGLVASYCFVTCATKTKFHSPKRTFRARLPPNFIEQSFQNERFARGFLEISQNKLPKRAFRARLPRNFLDQASKTSVSCEASSNFHTTSKCASRYNGVPFKISKCTFYYSGVRQNV